MLANSGSFKMFLGPRINASEYLFWSTHSGATQGSTCIFRQSLSNKLSVHSMCFDPNGIFLAFRTSNTIQIYNIKNKKLIVNLPLKKNSCTSKNSTLYFSPKGKSFVFVNGACVTTYRIQDEKRREFFIAKNTNFHDVCFSACSQFIAATTDQYIIIFCLNQNVKAAVWRSLISIAKISKDSTIEKIHYSTPDRITLITRKALTIAVTLWCISQKKMIEGYNYPNVSCFCLSSCGKFISILQEKTLKIIEFRKKAALYVKRVGKNFPVVMRFSQCGKFILSLNNDKTVNLWAIECQKIIPIQTVGNISDIAINSSKKFALLKNPSVENQMLKISTIIPFPRILTASDATLTTFLNNITTNKTVKILNLSNVNMSKHLNLLSLLLEKKTNITDLSLANTGLTNKHQVKLASLFTKARSLRTVDIRQNNKLGTDTCYNLNVIFNLTRNEFNKPCLLKTGNNRQAISIEVVKPGDILVKHSSGSVINQGISVSNKTTKFLGKAAALFKPNSKKVLPKCDPDIVHIAVVVEVKPGYSPRMVEVAPGGIHESNLDAEKYEVYRNNNVIIAETIAKLARYLAYVSSNKTLDPNRKGFTKFCADFLGRKPGKVPLGYDFITYLLPFIGGKTNRASTMYENSDTQQYNCSSFASACIDAAYSIHNIDSKEKLPPNSLPMILKHHLEESKKEWSYQGLLCHSQQTKVKRCFITDFDSNSVLTEDLISALREIIILFRKKSLRCNTMKEKAKYSSLADIFFNILQENIKFGEMQRNLVPKMINE